jgi:hypothetical protein
MTRSLIMEEKSKKILMEINQLIADTITYKQTNEQWFISWLDQINKYSVMF